MNKNVLNFDPKSLIIGFLLAAIAFLIFNGFSRPAQATDPTYAISAADDGVYIMNSGYVVFRQKNACMKGCN